MELVDWGDPADLENAAGNPLFKVVELEWQKPTLWSPEESIPPFDTNEPFLYVLLRDHWKSKTKGNIEYVGLTKSPQKRFGNHQTARYIRDKRGDTRFSYAPIVMKGRNKAERTKKTLEELEHLLIWALPFDLYNEKKQFTLPGLGQNGGTAWHIKNVGYRFNGRMPKEIIYPWMMIKAGRDRSAK